MQPRRLRLGDNLDDYCPRERRLTNHAVVAMIGEDVKRTRCTTCDAEHEYKAAKVPPRRKKMDAPGALYTQVLSGMPDSGEHAEGGAPGDGEVADIEIQAGAAAPAAEPVSEERAEELMPNHNEEEGPVHRPLLRAKLPRIEGPPARPMPEFTIRQSHGRDGNIRQGMHGRPGDHRGGARFSDTRQGRGGRGPQGKGSPFTSQGGSRPPSQPYQSRRAHSRHGRKRSK